MIDTAVIVTSYCGGTNEELKRKMTKTLCKRLFEAGHFVVLASHSTIDEETQNYCNLFVYDKDNSFSFNGVPERQTNHGVAELTSIHNALNVLPSHFKYMLKVSYDNRPDMDFHDLISKCKSIGKKVVTGKWANDVSLGTHLFFSNIEFYKLTMSLDELYRCEKDMEYVWFDSCVESNLLDQIHIIELYTDFLGHNVIQYAHFGGTSVDNYPYD
jgi:hypothetical protein